MEEFINAINNLGMAIEPVYTSYTQSVKLSNSYRSLYTDALKNGDVEKYLYYIDLYTREATRGATLHSDLNIQNFLI